MSGDGRVRRRRRLAAVSFALSVVLGAAGAAYFLSRGEPATAALVAVVLALAGWWEYRRKLADLRDQLRSEAE